MKNLFAAFMLVVSMFIATGTVLADLNNGLVAHYPFDGDANDESGNGNHGTLTNMDPATIWVAGKIGQAIDFDGKDDIVLVDNDPSLEPSTELTLSAWIRTPTGAWGDDNVISKDAKIGSLSNGYLLRTGEPEDEILFYAGGIKPTGQILLQIELNGISPIKSGFEDVTAPAANIDDECLCGEMDPDTFEDLVLKFDRQEIIESLGDVQDGQEITLSLLCKLQGGVTLIRGTDCIVIKKKKKYHRKHHVKKHLRKHHIRKH